MLKDFQFEILKYVYKNPNTQLLDIEKHFGFNEETYNAVDCLKKENYISFSLGFYDPTDDFPIPCETNFNITFKGKKLLKKEIRDNISFFYFDCNFYRHNTRHTVRHILAIVKISTPTCNLNVISCLFSLIL